MLQPNVLSHSLLLRHVRRLGSGAQAGLVLAALHGGAAAAESGLVVATPIEQHAATGSIEAAPPAVAPAVPAETGPIENRPTLDERQRRMLLLLMMNAMAQQPRFGTMGR
jgi:hypothetical protein